MSKENKSNNEIMKSKTKNLKSFTGFRLLIIVGGILGFALMLYLIVSGKSPAIDDPIRYSFYELRNPILDSLVSTFTHIGDTKTTVAICVILLLISPIRKDFGIPISAGAIGVSVVNKCIKHIVERPRPEVSLHLVEQGGFSFPSGHSITAIMIYGLAIWLVCRKVQNQKLRVFLITLFAFLGIGIGLSRIYCGVHYPSDVFAGWCLGLVGLAIETGILTSSDNKNVRR